MVKKLFLTVKVIAGAVAVLTIIFQSYFMWNNLDYVSSTDIVEYRSDPSRQQIVESILADTTEFERSLILSDKKSSVLKFAKYNQWPISKILMFSALFFFLLALEKWLFWLLKKDEPVKARPDKAS